MGYAVLITALCSVIVLAYLRMFFKTLMQGQEYEELTEEDMVAQMHRALAEQQVAQEEEEMDAIRHRIAAHYDDLAEETSRALRTAHADNLAYMRQEMDVIRAALREAVAETRDRNADMREIRHGQLADYPRGVRRRYARS